MNSGLVFPASGYKNRDVVLLCCQRGERQVQQNWLKHAGISTSQQQMFVNRRAFTRRKECDHLETALCGGLFFLFCGAVAEYFSIKWGGEKASLHSLAFHSELFPTCSGAGTHGDWMLNFHSWDEEL